MIHNFNIMAGGDGVEWAKIYTFSKNWDLKARDLDNGTLTSEKFRLSSPWNLFRKHPWVAGAGSLINCRKTATDEDYLAELY